MLNSIPATKAKNNFGELIKRVYTSGERVIVEKDGLPVVIISPVSALDLRNTVPEDKLHRSTESRDALASRRSATNKQR